MGTGNWGLGANSQAERRGELESAGRRSPVPSSLIGVVLPAGGSGQRLGGEPKQFRMLGDAPLLVQTVRAFARHAEVGPVVVAAPAASVEATRRLFARFEVEALVVAGGETRSASVESGLTALPSGVEVVLVHDAVRPFVSGDLISRVAAAVRLHGAAAAATAVADTLRLASGDRFGATVDRSALWAMQTPQGARRDVFLAAYAAAHGTPGEAPTDEAGLLALAGTPVAVVEGDARNLKVTTPTDWALAEALWPAWVAGM